MDKILNDIFHSVRDGFVSIVAKANDLAKVGRLKLDTIGIKHNIDKLFAELGERVYHLSKLKRQTQIVTDPTVQSLMSRIQELQIQMQGKRQQAHDIFYNEVLEERESADTSTTAPSSSTSPAAATTTASAAATPDEPIKSTVAESAPAPEPRNQARTEKIERKPKKQRRSGHRRRSGPGRAA